MGDNREENSNLDMFSLEMFENIAFVMAKHADPAIPNSPEEWLDGFNTFSIYQVLPQLIELWGFCSCFCYFIGDILHCSGDTLGLGYGRIQQTQ